MKNRKTLSLLLTGAMAAALLAVPTQAADPPPAVRVSSYKGNTLEVGEVSGLIIGPSGTEYAVVILRTFFGKGQCQATGCFSKHPHIFFLAA